MKQFRLWMFLVATPVMVMAQDLKDSDLIPFDPNVKTGKLKNGLTYYIRKNNKPEDKGIKPNDGDKPKDDGNKPEGLDLPHPQP